MQCWPILPTSALLRRVERNASIPIFFLPPLFLSRDPRPVHHAVEVVIVFEIATSSRQHVHVHVGHALARLLSVLNGEGEARAAAERRAGSGKREAEQRGAAGRGSVGLVAVERHKNGGTGYAAAVYLPPVAFERGADALRATPQVRDLVRR